ncbi:neuronal regeneration-related protein isoform 1-T1 [Pangshura tecta]
MVHFKDVQSAKNSTGLCKSRLFSLWYRRETAVPRLKSLKMVYQPRLTIWVCQELFPTSQGDGGFPKGNLTIPKEVNRKKNNETEAAFLTPANGYGYHFNYLYPF